MSGLSLPLRFLLLLVLYCVSASGRFIYKYPVMGLVACHPHQMEVLTQFKDEFDSSGCNQTDYYNGVQCDNTTGAVTKLQIPSGCLSGILKPNSSLFRLHHLCYLNLSNNDFTSSSLHSAFGNLNKLEVLSLSFNGFIGQVPSSFNNLSLLSYLDLYYNELTGSFPPLHNQTKLSALDLSNNRFSTLEPKSSLFGLHNLLYLDLSHNNFISSSLPFEFGNLNKLEVLSLSYNGFIGQVPFSFESLNQLTDLNLDHNKLTGSFPLVQNLTRLSSLALTNNRFTGTIPSSLFTMPLLSILALGDNHFNGRIEIPNSSLLSRLEALFLRGNNFEDQILKPISKLTTLTELDLSFLNISHPIDVSVFSSLKSLTYLVLSGNNLSPKSLSSDSGIPLSMEFLFLSSCNIVEFPNILKPLQNLLFIEISRNQIKGKLPAWLWKLPFLISVDLRNNSLNGFEGSADVLVNSSVRVLPLDINSFEGVLPHLPLSINTFSARSNNFSGNIPLSICSRNSLVGIDLAYNNFTGPIPHCLSNLTILSLRKNNLEGSIPDTFYANASLQTLDVGYNQLTGKLPRSLLNCSSLQFLTVDHNRIEDTFPFWLKALPNLEVLILRSNKLYGSIAPPDQGPLAFPELRIYEISDNNFTGSLPPRYFLNWKASSFQMNEDGSIYMTYKGRETKAAYTTFEDTIDIQYKGLSVEQSKILTFYAAIDFSGNRIEGQIPESIGLLKELIALNLSNNAFTGHIPLSLANLTDLESLDLSSNQLSGTIPNGMKTLSFLEYVNVSHNQLKGEIPQGTQITGQPKSSFEGNEGLCGLPLQENCLMPDVPPTQQGKVDDEEEEEGEEVLSWKAVVIGYGMGVLLGLAIAQVIASYKPAWLAKIICLNNRRNR